MKLVIDKNLSNNNYEVVITIADILESDTEMFKDFGNIQVNVGGELKTGGSAGTLESTVGDSFKYLPIDFPVVRVFTKAQYGEKAETVAKAYADTVLERIQTAITALKLKTDGFSGSTEVQM